MLVFNLDKIQKENILDKDSNIINIDLYIDTIDINYFYLRELICCSILEQVNKNKIIENTIFNINFNSKEKLIDEDIDIIFDTCTSVICNKVLCNNIIRNREQRLTTDMDGINYGKVGWLKLINNNTKINNFNIRLKYKDVIINLIEF